MLYNLIEVLLLIVHHTVETNVKVLPINTKSRRGVNAVRSTKFCFKLWARENLLGK